MKVVVGSATVLPNILFLIFLVMLNAFFSAAEMAIVSINKNKLEILVESGDKRAKELKKIIQEPNKLLSTIQVGITFAGFLASATAAVNLSEPIKAYISIFNKAYAGQISVILVTLILSYVTLVFGEITPKRLALKNAEKIALFSIGPIVLVYKFFLPFIKILSLSTNLVLKILGVKDSKLEEKVSKEEIKFLVQTGEHTGAISDAEREMIERIIEFDVKSAKEIMIPRTSMYAINVNSTVNEIFKAGEIRRYSRIPIYEEELDNIIGVLHTKDLLLRAYKSGFNNIVIKDIMRDAYFVPETKNINSLFIEMKNKKKHMAILIDEYGGVPGIVTLEDLLEEVVGNITDEYDKENDDIVKISDNKFLVAGTLSISDLNDYLGTNLESDYYDSVGGLILEKIGYIPNDNEKLPELEINDVIFKTKKIKNKKIVKIIVMLKEVKTEEE